MIFMDKWTLKKLEPFGLQVNAKLEETDLRLIPINLLKKLIGENRVVVLRGFTSLDVDKLPEYCEQLGEILEWNFGAVNNLRVQADAKNYLYTNREVPFHWDGAFVGRIPHYIFFQCNIAPSKESGGETLFCDTTLLLEYASDESKELWDKVEITYTTEKIVHYGGTFTSRMIAPHPFTDERVLRFAEPVYDLNPVYLEIKGVAKESQKDFLEDMNRRLNDERVCYAHSWMNGDIVIADNHTLLHGRRAFEKDSARHIYRVNIL